MGPQNAIVGDDSFGIDLPESQPDDQAVVELQKTARFSKSAEFKELKSYLESRMEFYRSFLPNGEAVIAQKDLAELGQQWQAANIVIGEFKAIIEVYERAAEEIKNESARRKRA